MFEDPELATRAIIIHEWLMEQGPGDMGECTTQQVAEAVGISVDDAYEALLYLQDIGWIRNVDNEIPGP